MLLFPVTVASVSGVVALSPTHPCNDCTSVEMAQAGKSSKHDLQVLGIAMSTFEAYFFGH